MGRRRLLQPSIATTLIRVWASLILLLIHRSTFAPLITRIIMHRSSCIDLFRFFSGIAARPHLFLGMMGASLLVRRVGCVVAVTSVCPAALNSPRCSFAFYEPLQVLGCPAQGIVERVATFARNGLPHPIRFGEQ